MRGVQKIEALQRNAHNEDKVAKETPQLPVAVGSRNPNVDGAGRFETGNEKEAESGNHAYQLRLRNGRDEGIECTHARCHRDVVVACVLESRQRGRGRRTNGKAERTTGKKRPKGVCPRAQAPGDGSGQSEFLCFPPVPIVRGLVLMVSLFLRPRSWRPPDKTADAGRVTTLPG
jgi:hypothetical protein